MSGAASRMGAAPAFGAADLSNCEREQIHLAGSIQPHGALMTLREPDLVVVQASSNAAAFLGLDESPLGRRLADFAPRLAAGIASKLDQPLLDLPAALQSRAGAAAQHLDGLIHRPLGGGLVLELERPGPRVDLGRHAVHAMRAILDAHSLRVLVDESAHLFRDLTGYDRVMVYRFDEAGHGEVLAEQHGDGLESYLGNRYPASDIPRIARRLYERNRVRVLVDMEYTPVPLEPRLSPLSGAELDMSMCVLRSSSPIHVQYLKNMGVRATLVVSLVVGGRLWGLVACHHYGRPRTIDFEARSVCELLAEAMATRIAALESFLRGQAELSVRRLEQRMIEAISREGDWRAALFDTAQPLLQPVGASGAALLFDGQTLTAGEVPGTQQLRDLGAWLDELPRGLFRTDSLGLDAAEFEALIPMASGVIAVPVSSTAGEYLIWFRPERVRTVTWGGDPFKPVIVGNDPAELSPRRSFAQWHQVVENTADPWTPADVAAANLIGDTVSDVILQFRAVRMLIAEDQLEQVRRQVAQSTQPVVIADASGRILLLNTAFAALLDKGAAPPAHVDDLRALLANHSEGLRLRDLLRSNRTWRGEVHLARSQGAAMPMLVRADPIFSSPDRVLGYVLMFTDVTERKEAEHARERFQEGLRADARLRASGRLGDSADHLARNVLATAIENAKLAGLEITDGADTGQMPRMLASIRGSVSRTVEVLDHLLQHAAEAEAASPKSEERGLEAE